MTEISPVTFETHDKFNLKSFSEKLERFLMVEHDFVEGSVVISLNAPFGAGKSTFLSMWKSDLDKRREDGATIPKAIIINAWESDYCGDPLLSIVNALIKAASDDDSIATPRDAGRLREAAKDVGWFVTGLANNLVSHWTGLDPASASELAEEKREGRRPQIPDFVALYDERTKALEKLKDTLREVFGGNLPKASVFVDELDRCRPDYAISYLETIKHVFDVHGLVFVLAVDRDQLECSAKALFGVDLRFSDYFRKFVQRTVTLPEPDESGLRNFAHACVTSYLEKEGKRTSLMQFDQYRVENIVEFFRAFKMPPRQIQEAFRIIGHTVAGDAKKRGKLYWGLGTGVILLAVLKVAEPAIYRRIGKDEATHEEVGKFLIRLLGMKSARWWFDVYLTGTGGSETNNEWPALVEKLFKNLGFIATDASFDQNELRQFASAWGHYGSNYWKQIYETIETTNSF